MEKNNMENQQNLIIINNVLGEKDAFDKCVSHLLNLNENLKDENFSMQWVEDVVTWQLAKNNIDEVILDFTNNKSGCIENSIALSSKGLSDLNLKRFAQLTDMLIHKFNHYITDLNNQNVKKDEFGNVNSRYISDMPYRDMYSFLSKHFNDKILLGDILYGMYYKCEHEEIARNMAFDENIHLVESAMDKASFTQKFYLKKLLDTIIKDKKKIKQSFAEDVSQYSNFRYTLQKISEDFQKDLTIKSDEDYGLLRAARYLYASDELDQANFKKLVDQNQVNSACLLIDEHNFRNNIDNIVKLNELLKHNNVHIKDAKFTTLDKERVLEVVGQSNLQKIESDSEQELVEQDCNATIEQKR